MCLRADLVLPTVLASLAFTLAPQALADDQSIRRLIGLVEYIGGDYTEAVRQGEIVNADEYKEMQDFAASAIREAQKLEARLPVAARDEINGNLTALRLLIERQADANAVRALTKAVKDRVIDSLAVVTAPATTPDEARPQALYGQACGSCHGAEGKGDGPAGQGLEPPPRNFHDVAVTDVSSPFKFYNTLVLGVDGTAMASYAKTFTDEELWSLSFLAMALRHGPTRGTAEARWADVPQATREQLKTAGLSLALLSRATDLELKAWLKDKAKLDAKEHAAALALLRVTAPFVRDLPKTPAGAEPAPDLSGPGGAPSPADRRSALDDAERQIRLAKAKFAAGDGAGAEALLLDGYLEGFEGAEAALGVAQRSLVAEVEQGFIAARRAARERDAAAFAARVADLEQALATSRAALAGGSTGGSGTGDFFASLVIILREGFEAFLIVGALLTLLTRTGAAGVKRWVHLGWVAAVLAGIASFFAFSMVFDLSGAARETVEAVSTGLAALVLFYVSFWLLNQAERGKWDRFLKESAKRALGAAGPRIGSLFFLSFIAVYREAAETVLFYQALARSATSVAAVAGGFVAGASLLALLCGAMMRFGVKLPLRKFFLITSSAMILISIVLVGKAVNELVEAGFVEPTTIALLPTVDVLGIYPNWESVGGQLAAFAAAAALAWLSTRPRAVPERAHS